ncbi:MAG: DUF4340 domain-containing protein [Lachnospiraceae bacterium]|nr:DUF4340 domain-containing protein [Lachnospiraceae bacterium]
MRKKQYIVLIIVLAAIVAALVGVIFGKKAKTAKEEAEAEAATVYVNQFDVSDVTAFTYLLDDNLVMFSLEDDVWTYMGDTTMVLDTDTIEDFLTEMSEVTADSVIEDVEDNSEYGVDSPVQMFAVVFSDGSSLTYCFGSENDIVGGYYLQVTDDADDTNNDTVYLVDSTIVTSTLATEVESFQAEEEDEGSVSE